MTTKKKAEIELARLKLEKDRERARYCLPHLYGFPFYKWAREFYESTNRLNFLCAGNQLSKAQCIKTEIPTPNGFKKLEDIQVGDYVFGRDGVPTMVIDVPYIGEDDAFEFEFNDGSTVIASKNHLWIAKSSEERFRKEYKCNFERSKLNGHVFENKTYGQWNVFSTEEIISRGKYSQMASSAKSKFSIPVAMPVEHSWKDLFDPYYVGLYIGNGSDRSVTFNSSDYDIFEYASRFGSKRKSKPGSLVTGISVDYFRELLKLNLVVPSYLKRIPDEYLLSSIEQRRLLLAGLVDTDGTCDKSGQNYNYSTTSEVLSGQFLELVCSLGGIGQIKRYASYYYKDGEKIVCKDHYVITFWTNFNPFRSKRKSALWRQNTRYKHERIINRITPIGKRRMKCITVDNDDGSFLCTRNYLVTHNSSTQIRKCINWATNPKLWPKIWDSKPNTFWYLYPSKEVATIEVLQKWVKEFLPKDEFKEHSQYGWDLEKRDRWVWAIHFKTGVSVFFKTYRQDPQMLQAGTAWAIFCFTAGHKVTTKFGLKNIEDLVVGDLVKTRFGYEPITRIGSREDDVYSVEFSNGEILEGTADHPIYTNTGWVDLGQLSIYHSAYTYPLWKLQKNLLFLRSGIIGAFQSIKTRVKETILGLMTEVFYMFGYGKCITGENYHMASQSIIKTLIRSTIESKICNSLLARSIRVFTSLMSGVKNRLRHSSAVSVVISLWDRVTSLLLGVTVPVSVSKPPTITKRSTVYTVTVANQPEYFCNGILVHNCDEEMDWTLFPEVSRRISATRGYFHLVFTATLGQIELKDIIEGKGQREVFPDAAKWQISMYDCQFYEDGTPSIWTPERINEEIRAIGDPREIERRIHGRFVLSSGLKYPGFSQDKNVVPPLPLETYKSWHIYAGVDIGSGSDASSENPIGHPSAITFIAVRPDFKYGRVFRGWIGDDVETSAGDVFNKYLELSADLNVTQQFYDYASKDFLIISQRAGASFEPAEKARDAGEIALNTLFKNGMLDIDDIPELQQLVRELVSLNKQKRRGDDFSDSLRYACVRIPWNFVAITEFNLRNVQPTARPVDNRSQLDIQRDERRKMLQSIEGLNELYEEEIAAWNELLET